MKPLFLTLILAFLLTACQSTATAVAGPSPVTETIPTQPQTDPVTATVDPFLILTATPTLAPDVDTPLPQPPSTTPEPPARATQTLAAPRITPAANPPDLPLCGGVALLSMVAGLLWLILKRD